MNVSHDHPDPSRVMLRGPKVQCSSGKIVTPRPFALEEVLAGFMRLREDARSAFLSIMAHSFTVDMRRALLDRPISAADAEQAWCVNEWLHQLTSSLNPRHRRTADGEADLIRAIAIESFQYGLEAAVGRAIAMAAQNVIAPAKEKVGTIG